MEQTPNLSQLRFLPFLNQLSSVCNTTARYAHTSLYLALPVLPSVHAKSSQTLFVFGASWYLDSENRSWIDPDPSNPDTHVRSPFWIGGTRTRFSDRHTPITFQKTSPESRKYSVLGGEVSSLGRTYRYLDSGRDIMAQSSRGGEVL